MTCVCACRPRNRVRQWQQATPAQDASDALKYTAAGPSGPKVSTVPRHPWDSPAAQKLLLERKPVILTGSNFTMFGTEKWTREYLLAHWDKGADLDCYVLASTMKMKSGKPLFYYTDRLPEGKRALTPHSAPVRSVLSALVSVCVSLETRAVCGGQVNTTWASSYTGLSSCRAHLPPWPNSFEGSKNARRQTCPTVGACICRPRCLQPTLVHRAAKPCKRDWSSTG